MANVGSIDVGAGDVIRYSVRSVCNVLIDNLTVLLSMVVPKKDQSTSSRALYIDLSIWRNWKP